MQSIELCIYVKHLPYLCVVDIAGTLNIKKQLLKLFSKIILGRVKEMWNIYHSRQQNAASARCAYQ